MSRIFALVCGTALLLMSAVASGNAQRAVKVTDAWVHIDQSGALAGATIENGTMYDIYIIGAESEVAGVAELVQMTAGNANVTKDLPIAAFDRLEMAPAGTRVVMRNLKKPLKAGESVVVVLQTDSGERLILEAKVK